MLMKSLLVLFLVVFLVNRAKCGRILGVFPAPGYRQFLLGEKLMLELATRGHDVTVISPYRPEKEPDNYRTISTDTILQQFQFRDDDLFEANKWNMFTQIMTTYDLGVLITELTLKHDNVQTFLNFHNESFDLIIVECFLNEAMYGFANHFNSPLVLFSSLGSTVWQNFLMGNPSLPSITPVGFNDFTRLMNFHQRGLNVIYTIYDFLYKRLVVIPKHQDLLTKYFPGGNIMDINDVIYNASLMLMNSHVTTTENTALIHGIVEIGGFHIEETQSLDEELQNYLDRANNGAIYFSLGTNLKPSHLSPTKIQSILKVFARLPQKILWKFDSDDLANTPSNLLISKWFKQNDILSHPNIQLFITHGGLLSTTEALFHGVPLVGIPVFGDQKSNMERARRNGYADTIQLDDLESEEVFFESINRVLNDGRYRENARKLSNILRDGIAKPLDLAMYWIEYVLRHRALHFKPSTLQLFWYEYYCLDILAFFFANVAILFVSVRFFFKRRTLATKCSKKRTKNGEEAKRSQGKRVKNKNKAK